MVELRLWPRGNIVGFMAGENGKETPRMRGVAHPGAGWVWRWEVTCVLVRRGPSGLRGPTFACVHGVNESMVTFPAQH